jgi:hypothetical protein
MLAGNGAERQRAAGDAAAAARALVDAYGARHASFAPARG